MQVLGEEREFLAATTQNLNTSMEEREKLLLEVAEGKAKVPQQLLSQRERSLYLVRENAELGNSNTKRRRKIALN